MNSEQARVNPIDFGGEIGESTVCDESDRLPDRKLRSKYRESDTTLRKRLTLTSVFIIISLLAVVGLHATAAFTDTPRTSLNDLTIAALSTSVLFLVIFNVFIWFLLLLPSSRRLVVASTLKHLNAVGSTAAVGLLLLMRVTNGSCGNDSDSSSESLLHLVDSLRCNPAASALSLPFDTAIYLAFLPALLNHVYGLRSAWTVWVLYAISAGCILASMLIVSAWNSLFAVVVLLLASASLLHLQQQINPDIAYHKHRPVQSPTSSTVGNAFTPSPEFTPSLSNKSSSSTKSARDAADMSAREMRSMIANVAHDLRTPLTGFLCGAELLSTILKDIEGRLDIGCEEDDIDLEQSFSPIISPIISPGSDDEGDDEKLGSRRLSNNYLITTGPGRDIGGNTHSVAGGGGGSAGVGISQVISFDGTFTKRLSLDTVSRSPRPLISAQPQSQPTTALSAQQALEAPSLDMVSPRSQQRIKPNNGAEQQTNANDAKKSTQGLVPEIALHHLHQSSSEGAVAGGLVARAGVATASLQSVEAITIRAVRRALKDSLIEDIQSMNSCLTTMCSSYDFMLMIVNRCVDFTKSSQGIALVPRVESFSIIDALAVPINCMREIQVAIPVSVSPLPDTLCPFLITDRQWLQDNILCLLSNAIKYSRHGPVVLRVKLTSSISGERKGRVKTKNTKNIMKTGSAALKIFQKTGTSLSGSGKGSDSPQSSPGDGGSRLCDEFDDIEALRHQLTQPHSKQTRSGLSIVTKTCSGNRDSSATCPAEEQSQQQQKGQHDSLQSHHHSQQQRPLHNSVYRTKLSPIMSPTSAMDNSPTSYNNSNSFGSPAGRSYLIDASVPGTPASASGTVYSGQQQAPLVIEQSMGTVSDSAGAPTIAPLSLSAADAVGLGGPPSSGTFTIESVPVCHAASQGTLPRSAPGYLLFEVEDYGIRLSEHEKQSLFLVHRPDTRNTGGAGLGLYCLAKRVFALGGDYGVEDRGDKEPGCCFWFTVPYKPDTTAEATLFQPVPGIYEVFDASRSGEKSARTMYTMHTLQTTNTSFTGALQGGYIANSAPVRDGNPRAVGSPAGYSSLLSRGSSPSGNYPPCPHNVTRPQQDNIQGNADVGPSRGNLRSFSIDSTTSQLPQDPNEPFITGGRVHQQYPSPQQLVQRAGSKSRSGSLQLEVPIMLGSPSAYRSTTQLQSPFVHRGTPSKGLYIPPPLRVLIVDPSPLVQNAAAQLLERHEHMVGVASTAQEALVRLFEQFAIGAEAGALAHSIDVFSAGLGSGRAVAASGINASLQSSLSSRHGSGMQQTSFTGRSRAFDVVLIDMHLSKSSGMSGTEAARIIRSTEQSNLLLEEHSSPRSSTYSANNSVMGMLTRTGSSDQNHPCHQQDLLQQHPYHQPHHHHHTNYQNQSHHYQNRLQQQHQPHQHDSGSAESGTGHETTVPAGSVAGVPLRRGSHSEQCRTGFGLIIIGMSSDTVTLQDFPAAQSVGMDDIICKPFQLDDFNVAIGKLRSRIGAVRNRNGSFDGSLSITSGMHMIQPQQSHQLLPVSPRLESDPLHHVSRPSNKLKDGDAGVPLVILPKSQQQQRQHMSSPLVDSESLPPSAFPTASHTIIDNTCASTQLDYKGADSIVSSEKTAGNMTVTTRTQERHLLEHAESGVASSGSGAGAVTEELEVACASGTDGPPNISPRTHARGKTRIKKQPHAKRGSVGTFNVDIMSSAKSRKVGVTKDLPPLRLLVVDDSHVILKTASMMLRKCGHKVDTAENGKVALDIMLKQYSTSRETAVDGVASDGQPATAVINDNYLDVVLIDLQMPVMDGPEAVRRMREFERADDVADLRRRWVQLKLSAGVTQSHGASSNELEAGSSNGKESQSDGTHSESLTRRSLAVSRDGPDAEGISEKDGAATRSGAVITTDDDAEGEKDEDDICMGNFRASVDLWEDRVSAKCKKFSTDSRHQFIIGMSANGDPATMQSALDAGADCFIPKPFDINDFNAAVLRHQHLLVSKF